MSAFDYSKLRVFADCGHAWLRVPLEDVRLACLQGLTISKCSFMNGKYAYLEEDCDLSAFIAFRQIPTEVVESWKISYCDDRRESHVRRYERFEP